VSDEPVLEGYRPGAIGELIRLHMAYYAPAWGFGRPFECKLAGEMGEFFARFDPARQFFLGAWRRDGGLVGAVVLDIADPDTPVGHLRWFIVDDASRGRGLGRHLLQRAVAFADQQACSSTYLTTFAGLDAARQLYERTGFALVEARAGDPWSGTVGEQRFERRRP